MFIVIAKTKGKTVIAILSAEANTIPIVNRYI